MKRRPLNPLRGDARREGTQRSEYKESQVAFEDENTVNKGKVFKVEKIDLLCKYKT